MSSKKFMIGWSPMQSIFVSAAALVVFVPMMAFAQSGTIVGTGSLLSPNDSPVWEERTTRTAEFWQEVLPFRKIEEAFHKQNAARRQKLYVHRKECNDDLRHANRDTRFKTMLKCYRDDLQIMQEIIREQKEYSNAVPGVTDAIRASAAENADSTVDAMATIIEAIDAGVFHTDADLIEAKTNLLSKYMAPYRTAVRKVRIDRTVTWIMHLLVQIQEVTMNETVHIQVKQSADEVGACLEGAETLLKQALETKVAQEFLTLPSTVDETVKLCMEKLRQADSLNKKVTQ